ncbi:unnamed protein product [Effrenium voratum]|nr:unnamed protein product [Effrenium voratum]
MRTRVYHQWLHGVCEGGVDFSEDLIAQATSAGSKVNFRVASVYKLPYDDNTFDVVFAHQVLQHLGDPMSALREMGRVCKVGGLIAVREASFSTMHGAPSSTGLQKWREVYQATARRNGGEPDAGLFLRKWMLDANLTDVRFTTSTVTYTSDEPEAHAGWGESWAERTMKTFGPQAVDFGLASMADLDEMSSAWKQWAADNTSVFVYVNGESIGRKK